MLKEIRHQQILNLLDMYDTIKICELLEQLDVTEMTVWRDLKELEQNGMLKRIHGGAKRIAPKISPIKLHIDRQLLNQDKKMLIAKKAAGLIKDQDIIFISSSTTNEMICENITAKNVRIITNSLTIFRQYCDNQNFETLLIGGKLDSLHSSFLGTIANDVVHGMSFSKSFMGTNGISQNNCSASNDEEGVLYRIVLNNSAQKYVVCDSTKFNKDAFYRYYSCDKLTAIITDDGEIENREVYEALTKLL